LADIRVFFLIEYFEDKNRIASSIEDFYVMGLPTNKRPEQLKRMAEYRKIIKELPSSCGKEMVMVGEKDEQCSLASVYRKIYFFNDSIGINS